MVKTRILLSTKNSNVPSTFTTVVKYIWKNAGPRGFYQGLSAAFMREAVYGTARLGIFDTLSAELKRAQNVTVIPLWQKAMCGLVAGALGVSWAILLILHWCVCRQMVLLLRN